MGDIEKFLIELKAAEKDYNDLMSMKGEIIEEEEDFNFVDMFKNVPKEILQA